jgi:hypothetical protein
VPELKRYYVAVSEHQDVITGVQGGKFEEAYIEVYEASQNSHATPKDHDECAP